MKIEQNKILTIATIVMMIAVIICAIFIMIHGLGLVDNLNFGAGAYFYADIPNFDKYLNVHLATKSHIPYWLYLSLSIIWGWLMYKLWVLIDKK